MVYKFESHTDMVGLQLGNSVLKDLDQTYSLWVPFLRTMMVFSDLRTATPSPVDSDKTSSACNGVRVLWDTRGNITREGACNIVNADPSIICLR